MIYFKFLFLIYIQFVAVSDVYSQNTIYKNCKIPVSHISEDTLLESNCIYNISFKITKPLALDCNDSVLDGGGELIRAINIDSLGNPLSGVVIKNCHIKNYAKTGIGVTWSAWDDDKLLWSRAEIYNRTPSNILIQNVTVDRSGAVGIYLDDYVSNVHLDNVTVSNSYGVGIYLEHSTRNNTISNSKIYNNGKQWKNVPWQPGVSIDSSAGNHIYNTKFSGNGKSSVSLYRNCQENFITNPHSVHRWQGSENNLIEGNTFSDENIGVWIGSRMTRNLALMNCGMLPYFVDGAKVYILDDAKKNQIINNTFNKIKGSSVIVEDDYNIIINNFISNSGVPAIKEDAHIRAKILKKPVIGLINNNIIID